MALLGCDDQSLAAARVGLRVNDAVDLDGPTSDLGQRIRRVEEGVELEAAGSADWQGLRRTGRNAEFLARTSDLVGGSGLYDRCICTLVRCIPLRLDFNACDGRGL